MWCGRDGGSHCTATHLSIHETPTLAATQWVAVRSNLSIGQTRPPGQRLPSFLPFHAYVIMSNMARDVPRLQ